MPGNPYLDYPLLVASALISESPGYDPYVLCEGRLNYFRVYPEYVQGILLPL